MGGSATVAPVAVAVVPAVSPRDPASNALSSPSSVTMPVTISWRSRQSPRISGSIASADTAPPVSAAPASSADSSARGQPKTTRSSGSPATPAAGSSATTASGPCEAVASAPSRKLCSNRLRGGPASAPALSITPGYPSAAPPARRSRPPPPPFEPRRSEAAAGSRARSRQHCLLRMLQGGGPRAAPAGGRESSSSAHSASLLPSTAPSSFTLKRAARARQG